MRWASPSSDADFDGVVTNRYAEPGQVVNCRPEGGHAGAAGSPGGGDRRARQAGRGSCRIPTTSPSRSTLDHVITIKAAGVRAIDPDRRSDDAHAQRLPHPERSAAGIPARHHRLGHLHAGRCRRASTCRRRRCSTRTARPFVWVVDPAKSTVSQREVTVGVARRRPHRRHLRASRRASASSLPACTASRPARRSRCRNERLQPLDLGAQPPLLRLVPDAG